MTGQIPQTFDAAQSRRWLWATYGALTLSVGMALSASVIVLPKAWAVFLQEPLEVVEETAEAETRPASPVRLFTLQDDLRKTGPAFSDPTFGRETARLSQPERPVAPRGSTRDLSPRIVAGRPAVVPGARPELENGLVQVARTLSLLRALSLPEPVARPVVATQVASAARPARRPVTLSTRSVASGVEAASLVLVSAVVPETERARPAARLSDPVPPRAGANPCGPRLADDIPRRGRGAADGSAVMARLGNGSGGNRDGAVVQEALSGNIPDHLRALQPVTFGGVAGGRQTQITICVTPDYLALGSDGDHVRVPMGLPAALRIADGFNMMLPTTRMVDAIYAQADLRLSPRPMEPTSQMSSTDYFVRHDRTLDGQMAEAGGRIGHLVAGHKKDLVLANRLSSAPGRVAIYGWHRSSGSPIQPLSTVHGEYYADYSHGVRLVARTAYVNGEARDLRELLTSGTYAELLNSGGPLSSSTIRLASLR